MFAYQHGLDLLRGTTTLVFHEACRKQAEVRQNRDSVNVRNIGKGETQHRNIKDSTQTWWQSNIRSLAVTKRFRHKLLNSGQNDLPGL